MNNFNPSQHFVPSEDVVTTIVIPTIVFCIGMVVAMLIGIHKSKQWELDKIVEIRRTRRVIQRITARLREKNFTTIQKARNLRKRAVASRKKSSVVTASTNNNVDVAASSINSKAVISEQQQCHQYVALPMEPQQSSPGTAPPPSYMNPVSWFSTGYSPPPTYEDSLLDQLYAECMPEVAASDSNDVCDEFGEFVDDHRPRRASKSAGKRRKSSTSVSSKRSHRR